MDKVGRRDAIFLTCSGVHASGMPSWVWNAPTLFWLGNKLSHFRKHGGERGRRPAPHLVGIMVTVSLPTRRIHHCSEYEGGEACGTMTCSKLLSPGTSSRNSHRVASVAVIVTSMAFELGFASIILNVFHTISASGLEAFQLGIWNLRCG